MAKGIAVVGPSGSGKSTSIENLDPKANFIINVASKPLPFRGWKKNYVKGKNIVNMIDGAQILALIQKISTEAPHIKSIVVEDAQYIMSDEFMRKANEVGFTKFTMIAKHLYDLASPSTMAGLRDDLTIFFLFHDEKSDDGGRKIKTIGSNLPKLI